MLLLTTHRGCFLNPTTSGNHFKKENLLMEINQDELKAHLMATDETFRRLADQHAEYHRKLEALEAKPHLTDEERVEEHRLKKLKLHLKDQMTDVMARHKAQQVA